MRSRSIIVKSIELTRVLRRYFRGAVVLDFTIVLRNTYHQFLLSFVYAEVTEET